MDITCKREASRRAAPLHARRLVKLSFFALLIILGSLTLTVLYLLSKQLYGRERAEPRADYDSIVRYDPAREGGHLVQNFNELVIGETIDKPVRFITNSKGFRNDKEFDYRPSEGVFRILLLGDSYVDGFRTDQEETIASQLERYLNSRLPKGRFEKSEVLSAGNNNPARHWYYYQEHGRKYHPHLVLMGITLANDLTWHSYKAGVVPALDGKGRPFLQLRHSDDRSARSRIDLFLPSDAYDQMNWFDTFHLRELEIRARYYLAKKSDLFVYHVPPWETPAGSTPRHAYAAGVNTALGLFYLPSMPEISEMFSDLEEVLWGFNEQVKEDHHTFAAVLFPIRTQVSSRDWSLLRRSLALREDRFDLAHPNNWLKQYCVQKKIPCLDPIALFQLYGEKEYLYMPRGESHFNARGQEIAGATIGQYVLQNFLRD
jgi:hypothetical protein